MLLDAIDGKVASVWGYDDEVGKLSDLYADHIFANVIWVALASLGLVSVWIPLVTTTRDLVVDWFRQASAVRTGLNGFQQVRASGWRWVVSSRTMRFLYAGAKVVVWCAAVIGLYFPISGMIRMLVGLTVGLCLLRAIPAVTAGWRHVFLAEPTL